MSIQKSNLGHDESLIVETSIGFSFTTTVDGARQDVADEGALATNVAELWHADPVPTAAGVVGHRQKEQVAVLLLIR